MVPCRIAGMSATVPVGLPMRSLLSSQPSRGSSVQGTGRVLWQPTRHLTRGRMAVGVWAAAQVEEGPPKPNEKFKKKDLLRIKRDGPSIDDLVHKHVREVEDKTTKTTSKEETLHIPLEVLGNAKYNPEPNWHSMKQISLVNLLRGLRERNWTNELYNPKAEPWKLEFFTDSGRFLRNSFTGYRLVITRTDGSQIWCNLPNAGVQTFLEDYRGGGGDGAIYNARREPVEPDNIKDYGYNHVMQEIFQAFEPKLGKKAERELQKTGYLDPQKHPYSCPGEQLLDISFHQTPQELNLSGVWSKVPAFFFFGFAFSFLGICLAIGIFRPRKMMPGDPVQAMEFAQSKGKARKEGLTDVRFADVAGLDETVKELNEVVEFLKNPKRYSEVNAKPPKGVLLEGGPGTGKTMVAKAIAGESGVPFYQMAGSEFVEIIVGVGAARVRDLFKRARVNAPCIIFVDEIDALGIKRAEAGMKTNEEREQTLNQLLTEMDGFTPDIGVVFVAATNRADLLDPALMRAGRFDRKVRVLKPDTAGRAAVLRVHARKHPIADEVDFDQLARDLPGLSGAELANILNESALEALRNDRDVITNADLYNAIDRILQGVRRPPLSEDMKMREVIATHEIGKGIVAQALRHRHNKIEEVERISIVARGRDLSRVTFLRGSDEDYTMTTRERLLERVRVLLAGRAAEDVIYGPGYSTTYAGDDIKDVYGLAEKVVTAYGMTELGITTWAPAPKGKKFMERSFEVHVDNIDADLFGNEIPGGFFQPSNSAVFKIRAMTHNLINEAYQDCIEIIESSREALMAAREELLSVEQITGARLGEFLTDHPPKSIEATREALGANGLAQGTLFPGPQQGTRPAAPSSLTASAFAAEAQTPLKI